MVNQGAIEFNVPASSNVDAFHFLWWNADFTSTVDYKIIVQVLDNDVMFQPSLNISHSGQVPKKPTYWRMSLPCNHLTSGKATLEIHVDLGSDVTGFKLKRDKYCESTLSNMDSVATFHTKSSVSSHVVFIYSLLASFLIALILSIFVSVMQKKTRAALQETLPLKNEDPSPLLPPIGEF